ncbi:phytanoyl-CoA dioxygenase family protein [Mucilaginibacter sp. OK098]|uniref:phytanoyl-CoA dioxygenase family protein n=1 Tax=Mucilaginibacter sp. OK098 TaxID=1855297 RepID=UPI000919D0C2|nr:phytanoyl-CoA dioxygenase family protein [Mucilaginibacter sp. OK098]SHM96298.1 Phytanoyl-CoA dioxygenase (PhyH) [Mucilaginibacter sp. OK098]
MHQANNHRENITTNGFTILNDIYTADEIDAIIATINKADQSKPTFRKSNDLFAIRQFLKGVPGVKKLIFNDKLKSVIHNLFGDQYFVVKSIYFDKPEKSNWFVAWHQDLTISVDRKVNLPGYGPWTTKLSQFAVQPPIGILQDNFTIRIHLDDTDEGNGALKVISSSHLKNIYRVDNLNWKNETETTCNVNSGGIMIMRPLLLHASNRTTTNKKRRVVHIEFSKIELPVSISWAEMEKV